MAISVPSPDFNTITEETGPVTAAGIAILWKALSALTLGAGGTVNGPTPTVVGDVALWNNTLGTLLKDGGAFAATNLTDYATGTWTPADGSGAGLVLTVASSPYIKIGKMVFASFAVTYPTTANGSGASISGLPFTSATETTPPFPVAFSFTNSGLSFTGIVVDASTRFSLFSLAGAAITNAQMSTFALRGTAIYQSV